MQYSSKASEPAYAQYYTALKLNKVETAMVRIQEASHEITEKPSNEISKVKYTLGWFDKFKSK